MTETTFEFEEFPSLPKFRFETLVQIGRDRDLSQIDLVHLVLEEAEGFWVCGSFFYGDYLQAARNRIAELRNQHGHTILSEACPDPYHRHRGRVFHYRWIA